MSLYSLVAVLLTLTALFSLLNERFLRLPTAIGVMLSALVLSLVLLLLGKLGLDWAAPVAAAVRGIDFSETLMHGILCYLLFAGALFIDLGSLLRQKWAVGVLATVGVALSTLIVGALSYWLLPLFGLSLSFGYCLLFGALISPTDPIAVIAILRKAGVRESIETKITGESLFNDGLAVVLFTVLLSLATGTEFSGSSAGLLLAQEALGGILLGLILGGLGYWLLRQSNEHAIEILITLALVSGGYALALQVHVSGPLAMVTAGLMIGNHGSLLGMSRRNREHLHHFWELLDEILNAMLFLLLGLELLLIHLPVPYLLAGIVSIAVVLLARLSSVSFAVMLLQRLQPLSPGIIRILTWGGLRGGISIALALALPPGAEREAILSITYCVVLWSLLVQGLSIGRLAKQWGGQLA